jgi:glucose/arabinose dehydrogenase
MRIRVRLAAAAVAAALLSQAHPQAAILPQTIRLVPYASGFSAPVGIVQDPTDSRVQFVIEQGGRVRTVVGGVVQATDFLDLSASVLCCGERGLLGLAFPPNDPGRFYVNYTRNPDGHTVVARFRRSANPQVADRSSRIDVLWSTGTRFIVQDFANHNGGCLQFGPDGYLYIGMGDGGSGNDPNNHAQDPNSLLGKMLRIDVSRDDPNGIVGTTGNPFVDAPGYRPEIWDVGLRNPWRFSFDDVSRGGTGALVIADVGQGAIEEVDYEPAGRGARNYGWRIKEGTRDNIAGTPLFQPLTNPIHEYDHSVGASITGGYVYRGSLIPELRGRYVFADFVRGRIWSLGITLNGSGEGFLSDLVEHTGSLQVPPFNVSSFGVDSGGELFVVNYFGGIIYKLVRGAPRAPTNLRIIR